MVQGSIGWLNQSDFASQKFEDAVSFNGRSSVLCPEDGEWGREVVGDKERKGEGERDRERTCIERGREILNSETTSPWIVRNTAGSFHSCVSGSQAPSRRTGCTSCLFCGSLLIKLS